MILTDADTERAAGEEDTSEEVTPVDVEVEEVPAPPESKASSKASGLSMVQTALALTKSGYFSERSRLLTASQTLTKILAGQELGLPPVASVMGVYIVQGRVGLSANLIGALIKRSGRYDYRVVHLDRERCRILFIQRDRDGGWTEIGDSEFSIDDARLAGLLNRGGGGERGPAAWQAYPRNMLFSRALVNGARWHTPDIFSGAVYLADELAAPGAAAETTPEEE